MKRVITAASTLALLLALLLCGCGTAVNVDDIPAASPTAGEESPTKEPVPENTQTVSYGNSASVSVTDTVCYTFGSNVLYGAAEYKNTGDCPVIITGVVFGFAAGSETVTREFVPFLNEYDIVMPGESSYIVFFETMEDGAPEVTSLTAELSCQKSEEVRISLGVDDLYVSQNYPTFATLSGTITNNTADCSLNMIYAAFYDEQDSLIGVWYFSDSSYLTMGSTRSFVVNMNELKIDNLSEKAVSMKAMGFGFN